jgi:hypothetical protein
MSNRASETSSDRFRQPGSLVGPPSHFSDLLCFGYHAYGSTQQFQLFRRAAIVARQHLGLPQEVGNVLRILNQEQEGAVP